MQVEAELIKRSAPSIVDKNPIVVELHRWKRLFSSKVVNRTMIGIMMMFFQRMSEPVIGKKNLSLMLRRRVEWNQCLDLLRPSFDEAHRSSGRHPGTAWLWWYRHRPVLGSYTGYPVHRSCRCVHASICLKGKLYAC